MLLGIPLNRAGLTLTGLSPSTAPLSNGLQLHTWFLTPRPAGRLNRTAPQPHLRNPCRVSHAGGLASSDFARHYSRNHYCFLFLWVLRCFTSPRSLYPPYIFRRESPGRHAAQRGFPIRTPSDQSVLIHSPRLIADCYVLLRLQMPRHPPFALRNLKSHEIESCNTTPKGDAAKLTSEYANKDAPKGNPLAIHLL